MIKELDGPGNAILSANRLAEGSRCLLYVFVVDRSANGIGQPLY